MKPVIHFAHANGFPAASYGAFFDALAPQYEVCHLPLIGHDPNYPVTNNWPHLIRQLIDSIERQCDRPVIGVGHSLGGGLTLMASIKRPDLFEAVIMLDVPVFRRWEGFLVRVIKALGLIDRVTPARRSKNRRTHWPDEQSAFEYFQTRGLFRGFDPRCLRDYVTSATRTAPNGGVELAYELPVELAIFRTVPHTLSPRARHIRVPSGVIVGLETDTVMKQQYLHMKHRLNFLGERIPGSHLFPLEHPEATAHAVDGMARRLLRKQVA